MKRIAFLFPGQGSQKIGMGKDVYNESALAKEIFLMAEKVTGLPIRTLCFEGPPTELAATKHLQPALTTINLALLACIFSTGIRPVVCAGHSLGEYSALAAANIVSPWDCLRLVQKRGELMHRESSLHKGTMQAIVGLDIGTVSAIVESAANYGRIVIANHNSQDQLVITGTPECVKWAGRKALDMGAKVIPLRVSGAWHSPLVNGALSEFEALLSSIEFRTPAFKVLHNVTAAPEDHPDDIRTLMSRQLCSRVRWFEIMLAMMNERIDVFVEIGPGTVLTKLLKKTLPKPSACRIYNVFNFQTLAGFCEAEA